MSDHYIEFFASGDFDCAKCSCNWWVRIPHNGADRIPKMKAAVLLHLTNSRWPSVQIRPVSRANGHNEGAAP